jgi:glycosyltransferase involved in cell wall biosynthesis
MSNILFLLDYYYPDASVNGICCGNIITELKLRKENIFVGAYRQTDAPLYEYVDGVAVYKTWSSEQYANPIDKRTKLKHYVRWVMPGIKNHAVENRLITDNICEITRKIIVENSIDTLICVNNPKETLIAGKRLKSEFASLRVYAYMLDPILGGFGPRYLPQKFCNFRNHIWESNILSAYDNVILMEASRCVHEAYNNSDAWYEKAVYLDVPLLLKQKNTDISLHGSRDNKIKVTYCGLLDVPMRNLERFLRLISAQGDSNIIYTFAGKTNQPELFSKCSDNVNYLGPVSHERVQELLEEADIFLNLGVRVPSAISGKIFEYMAYGKPIISTYSIDDEACIPYLREYPLSLLVDERDNNLEDQVKILNKFMEENKNKRIDNNSVKKIFYKNTPEVFVNTLFELGGNE